MSDSTVALEASDKLHPGWHILLQHPAITQQQLLVCQLLCVSGSMRSALHEAAAGQVLCRLVGCNDRAPHGPWDYWEAQGATAALLASTTAAQPVSETTAESFRAWLVQHASLLHILDLGCEPQRAEAEALTAAVATGFAGAAAADASRPLLLQGYRGCWDDTILQHLPAATLTYLSITDKGGHEEPMTQEYEDSDGSFGHICRTNQALFQRFKNLRHLGCIEHDHFDGSNVSALLPALGVMTQLTYLDLNADRGVERYFKHLPASLVEMRLGGGGSYRLVFMDEEETCEEFDKRWPAPMDLGHLTALTSLHLHKNEPFRLQTGDILPPNLLKLHAACAISWEPVLQLAGLHTLHASQTPVGTVAQMAARLTNLQTFTMRWAKDLSAADVGVYAKLPTRVLDGVTVSAAAVQQLAMLTALTRLNFTIDCAGTPSLCTVWQQVAASVQRLRHLVDLSVGAAPSDEHGRSDWQDTSEAALPLAIALAGLPALRGLTLSHLSFSFEAAEALAAATALTKLGLRFADLQDVECFMLVLGMPNLGTLDVCYNNNITDAVMPVVARLLPVLRVCNVYATGLFKRGIGCLKRSPQLRKVHVSGDMATAERLLGDKVLVLNRA